MKRQPPKPKRPLPAPPRHPAAVLPDFDLAPLRGFDPDALRVREPMGSFVLLLAAVFNDLKGAAYVVERLRDAFSKAGGRLDWRGQLSGMVGQTSRVLAGVLRELMDAIKEHRDIVDSAEFATLLRRMPVASRTAWQRVRLTALELVSSGGDSDLLLLVKIRGAFAFHYSERALVKGYERSFVTHRDRPNHDRAVLSDGNRMEATRFYFADAAIEDGLHALTELDADQLQRRLSALAQHVNNALKTSSWPTSRARRPSHPTGRRSRARPPGAAACACRI
jgi:hypothetical protein